MERVMSWIGEKGFYILMVLLLLLVTSFGISGGFGTGIAEAAKSFTVGLVGKTYGTAPDYTCNGTNDQTVFATAIAALPAGGGEIVILQGAYNFSTTVTPAKNNITIRGVGKSAAITTTGVTAPFTIAASTGWRFTNFACDDPLSYLSSGGVPTYAIIDGIWINGVYTVNYPAPETIVRSTTCMIAASDASASEIAQADFVCDGSNDEIEFALAQTYLDGLGSGYKGRGIIGLTSGTYTFHDNFSATYRFVGQSVDQTIIHVPGVSNTITATPTPIPAGFYWPVIGDFSNVSFHSEAHAGVLYKVAVTNGIEVVSQRLLENVRFYNSTQTGTALLLSSVSTNANACIAECVLGPVWITQFSKGIHFYAEEADHADASAWTSGNTVQMAFTIGTLYPFTFEGKVASTQANRTVLVSPGPAEGSVSDNFIIRGEADNTGYGDPPPAPAYVIDVITLIGLAARNHGYLSIWDWDSGCNHIMSTSDARPWDNHFEGTLDSHWEIGLYEPALWVGGGTAYALNDEVSCRGVDYRCFVAHNSNASFDVDFAAGRWTTYSGEGNTFISSYLQNRTFIVSSEGDGDFTTLSGALAALSATATAANPQTIVVKGKILETAQIVAKPYINVRGENAIVSTSYNNAADGTHRASVLFDGGAGYLVSNCTWSDITFEQTGTATTGGDGGLIRLEDAPSSVILRNIRADNNDAGAIAEYGIWLTGTVGAAKLINCRGEGADTLLSYGIYNSSTTGGYYLESCSADCNTGITNKSAGLCLYDATGGTPCTDNIVGGYFTGLYGFQIDTHEHVSWSVSNAIFDGTTADVYDPHATALVPCFNCTLVNGTATNITSWAVQKTTSLFKTMGVATLLIGQTHIDVTHGLGQTPTYVYVTPSLLGAITHWWVSGTSSTEFIITSDQDPTTDNATFYWMAVV